MLSPMAKSPRMRDAGGVSEPRGGGPGVTRPLVPANPRGAAPSPLAKPMTPRAPAVAPQVSAPQVSTGAAPRVPAVPAAPAHKMDSEPPVAGWDAGDGDAATASAGP